MLSARFALPVQAADLVAVPQNVRQPAVLTPVPVQTRPNELSLEALETKISDIFKPEKKKAALATTYSGTCGDNVNWRKLFKFANTSNQKNRRKRFSLRFS